METKENFTDEISFLKERVQLERDAITLERETLNSERAKLIAAATAANMRLRFVMIFFITLTVLLSLLAFSSGWLCGKTYTEEAYRQEKEQRLQQALSRLGEFSHENISISTNNVKQLKDHPSTAHRNVSVMVIQ